jgi:hypothetical protein
MLGKQIELEDSAIDSMFFLNRAAFEFDRRARTKFTDIPTVFVDYQIRDFDRRPRDNDDAVPKNSVGA